MDADTFIPSSECFNNTLWLLFIDSTGGVLNGDLIYLFNPTQVSKATDLYQRIDEEVAVQFIIDLRRG